MEIPGRELRCGDGIGDIRVQASEKASCRIDCGFGFDGNLGCVEIRIVLTRISLVGSGLGFDGDLRSIEIGVVLARISLVGSRKHLRPVLTGRL